MKKITLFLSAIALVLSFSACDELANLLSVTFEDVEVEKTIEVTNLEPTANSKSANVLGDYTATATVTFTESDTFNVADANSGTSDENIADYLDQLTGVTVNSTEFTIPTTYKGELLPEMTVNLITVSLSCDNGLNYSETLTNVTTGVSFELVNFTTEIQGKLANALQNKKDIVYSVSGSVTGDIVGFDVVMKVIADIKASPLAN